MRIELLKSCLFPALIIASIMAPILVVSILTTGVSATHTPTVSIDKDLVKANTPMVLTITVQNAGPDAIENVRVILPTVFTGLAPTVKVPKDNTVELAAPDNENVVLAAGTKVKLTGATTVTIPENTWLIRLANDNVFYEEQAGTDSENLRLVDNVRIKKNATVSATGLTENDNVITVAQTKVSLNENDVVTLAETIVVRVSGNIVRLPENTLVKVPDATNCRTVTAEHVTTEKEKTIVVDNGSNWVTQESATVIVIKTGLQSTLPAGAWVRLWLAASESDENRVVLSVGSKVRLAAGTTTVMLYDNENVLRVAPGATENIYLTYPASAENKPKNWEQYTGTSTLPSGPYVEWVGIADNQIAGGASLDFPFAVTTPSGTAYTIYVKTTDSKGATVQKEITLTVDNVPPTVTVAASPSWVKDNVAVTITVKASEPLAKLENVMVAENNAPENTQVIMTSADGITWAGTYTTGDNWLRDGVAKVYVIMSQVEDLVDNVGSGVTENTFTVDRCKPPKPNLGAITGFPVDLGAAPGIQTNIGAWTLEGIANDNLLGAISALENGTVRIRVGIATYDAPAYATGYFYKSITLTEGTQEVGIQYIDLAGNVGEENAENVTYDKTKPSFSMTSPAAGAIINDNTPSFVLVITDAVMGVENDNFNPSDNSGYLVRLCRDDNSVIAQLTPKVFPTSAQFNSFTFENDYPSELPDNFYKIFVQAGDNLQSDNAYFRFRIDTVPPAAPTLTATASQNPAAPDIKKSTTVSLGGISEAGATIRIWTSPEPFTVETNVENVVAGADGIWTASITISQGVNTRIRVSAVDTAGNESTTKTLYGYLMVVPEAEIRTVIYPAADVYAFSGNGTRYSRSQLKFDISSIQSGSNILSAKLWLYRFAADNWDGEILLNRVDDQLWGENITAIEFDAETLTNEKTQASKFMSPGWDYLDVEDQLNVDHGAGHAYSSYRLRWANDDGSEPSVGIDDGRFLVIESELDELCIFFPSSEYDGRDPYLEVVYVPPRAVSVSISPTYKVGVPGEELSYTVMVANTGGADDNYVLTVSDNAGWGPTVFPTPLAVDSGALGEATLTVTIPENAKPCTLNNITVTTTSQADNTVSDNDSCTAHVEVVRGVEVSILPDYQENLPGGTLEYTVAVRNLGNVTDDYDLIAQDIENWNLTLMDNLLEVPAGENRQTILIVTIPEIAAPCTEDNITVIATSRTDNTVSDNDSCIAHAEVVYGVKVSILPEYQEALIGGTLNYTVTVTNTGMVDDNYNLTVVDNENWNPSIVSSIAVPAFENQMTTLTVTIPENAIGCTLTVTATSQTDNTVKDNDICIAHAFYVWQIDEAIDEGVAWLAAQQNPDGSWGSWYPVGQTGLAVLKLAEHAVDAKYGYGLPSPFDPAYPYREHVEKGLNYIFSKASVIDISVQPAGNPDTNGDNKGVYFSSSGSYEKTYETSIAMMAIAGSRAPERVVNVPGSPVDNWKYKDVLQDAVDYMAWGQTDSGYGRGGWYYDEMVPGEYSDQSNTGFAVFGLGFAESPAYGFMCTIPAFVRTEMNVWIDYIQNDVDGDARDGGAGYTSPDYWVNILKTGHLLYMMEFVGDTAATPRVQDAVAYIVRNWAVPADGWWSEGGWYDSPAACYLSMYNVMKGLAGLGIHVIDGIDWQTEFEEVLIDQQLGDGSWPLTRWDWGYDGILSTEWALLTLQKVVPPFRKVEVTISPDNQSGTPGSTLTYTVTVKNLGTINDIYELTVSDSAGWGPSISPTVLTVPAGENRTATLTVTVPSGGTSTTITVTARSRADPSVSDSASCTATATVPPPAIEWDALITATFSGGSDDAIFGARPDASSGFDSKYDIPEPPAPPEPPYVRAYFYYPEQVPDELHRSCLAPENLMEWPLRIEYAEGLTDITLTWNVENIPTEYSVLLYRGGKLVADMRAENSYTFEASAGSYDFKIIVGKLLPFTLELTQGWNMISFPVLLENMSPDSIFDGYYVLYRWDAENKRYVLHADSGDFIEPDPDVEVGVGYWVYVLEDENVDLLGVPVNQLDLSLRQGWNLIGSPYGGSSIADPADDPDDSVLPWAFTWNAREKRYDMTQLLEAGKGYWVYTLRDCTLTLPAPKVTPPPSAMLTVMAEKSAANTVKLTISHEGGDDLVINDLQIKATNTPAGGMVTIDNPDLGVGATFTVGESGAIEYEYIGVETGDMLTVDIIHKPSHQKIFSSSNVVVQAPIPPSVMLSVTAENTSENTYKLTISHEGGDDLSVSDLEIQASDSDTTMATYAFPGTGTFSVGEQAILENCTYNEPVEGKMITVYIIHVPSGQKLFSSSSVVVK